VAGVCAGLGDKDKAFAWLNKDLQQRSGQLPTVTWRSLFDSLHSDPRFTELTRAMGSKVFSEFEIFGGSADC
jgi:hypothetical protein